MLYRLATLGIIAFWLVMMALLVRLETHPEQTDILDVPVSYVMRIMFKHGQLSRLTVTDAGKSIGTISLRPITTGSGTRSLDISGLLYIPTPMAARRRINFHGIVDLDMALTALDFQASLELPESQFHLGVKGDMARNVLSYDAREGTAIVASQTLPMDAAAIIPALSQNLGLAPNTLPAFTGGVSPPEVTARETQIKLGGEQLQVYEIAVREGGAPVGEIYVSQLGQIVLANTNFGYTLTAEDYP
jgi:hypothetical protein